MNEVGLAVSQFLTTHIHRNGPQTSAVPMCFPGVQMRFIFLIQVNLVMPIRRAAATPTQEKAPSSAAEKG